MPKPASRTITYIVYEPDYKPGMRHRTVKNLRAAFIQARKYGNGSEVWRQYDVKRRDGSAISWWDQRPWIYEVKNGPSNS